MSEILDETARRIRNDHQHDHTDYIPMTPDAAILVCHACNTRLAVNSADTDGWEET